MMIRPAANTNPKNLESNEDFKVQNNINIFSASTMTAPHGSTAVLHSDPPQPPSKQPQKTLISAKLNQKKVANHVSREGFPDLTRLVEAVLVKRKQNM